MRKTGLLKGVKNFPPPKRFPGYPPEKMGTKIVQLGLYLKENHSQNLASFYLEKKCLNFSFIANYCRFSIMLRPVLDSRGCCSKKGKLLSFSF